jgi:hypothetical protein
MKKVLQGAIVVLVAAAVSLVGMGSAHAAPFWQTYTKTSNWLCKTVPSAWITTVQSCIVVNGTATQAVVLVTNNTSDYIYIQSASYTEVPLAVVSGSSYYYSARDLCSFSALGAGLTRACFARTFNLPCSVYVQAFAAVEYMIQSAMAWQAAEGLSYTRKMCT